MTEKKVLSEKILVFVLGILLGAGLCLLTLLPYFRKMQRSQSELAAATVASAHLNMIGQLRGSDDDLEENAETALSFCEGALAGDLELLSRIPSPDPVTAVLLEQIRNYFKRYPLPEKPAESAATEE